ncbi:uncharacterized protein LOC115699863 [Cannabis sativa]|uniref:uncharacterized protein LOC115699863 n=1 Tax=Cannabis sativa TaxID=3483 RepID=UPI0029C9B6CB|nr:uncharacterized protein LOC115699863 [Cannabis sativa]
MPRHSSSSSSSSDNDSDKEDERHVVRSTAAAEPNPPPPPPSDQHQPPASVVPGYPPVMGYPQSYSNNNGYHHHPYNPYTQPPPPHYYTNQTYPYAANTNSGGSSSFIKGFFVTLILIILLICVSTIITWIILRPQIPTFHVDRLEVNDLNLSKTNFSATIQANLTVENPNKKLKINFHEIKGYVFFRERSLSSSEVDPIFLETETRGTMRLRVVSKENKEDLIGGWVVDEMRREREHGLLSLNVRLAVFATFKSSSWWTRHAYMKVFCEHLDVRFVGSADNGVWIANNNSPKCEVY